MLKTAATLLIVLLLAPQARAAPCAKLSPGQKTLAKKIFSRLYPYACCDETLDRCLKAKKVCKLAKRLRDDVCRRLLKGQNEKKIKNAMDRRARSMTALGKKAGVNLSGAAPAGAADSKVQVVVYACARCPFCSKVVPDLYRKVTSGGLKGKVKLYFRPFPIRSHKGSVPGGLAFVAAQKLNKQWPYLLHLYGEYDKFAEDKLVPWAVAVGLDRAAFQREMKDPSNRKLLVAAKKEGLRNGVAATPTLFIDGRKYHGDLDSATLLDVLDEESDRVAGKQFCDAASKRYFH